MEKLKQTGSVLNLSLVHSTDYKDVCGSVINKCLPSHSFSLA